MRKFFKTTGLLILGLFAVLLLAGLAFLQWSPEFGGTPTTARQQAYARTGHYQDGKFRNPLPTPTMTGGSQVGALRRMLFEANPQAHPPGPLPMRYLDSLTITQKPASLVRVTWFGHSASLVEIAGKNILLDPMLSIKMGPVPGVAPVRYNPRVPITAEKLPPIDAVLISHDHYDHLDYQTIKKIKSKTAHFYVPLGIGAHLLAWGVAPAHITEMSWGDSVRLPGLTLISTPTRHFSGRGLTNRDATFWTSWVLKTPTTRLFYSGDGGYGPHFQQIGRRYGPFDLALMECGQYDPQWALIHMQPEQSVQAALDVRARAMLPVHWGAFTEAHHAWNNSVKRATAAAARQHLSLTTPELGQPVVLGADPLPQQPWWQ
jgi:L-ascorbate metabolism protein UlaG (beta-lactamase superfamily)